MITLYIDTHERTMILALYENEQLVLKKEITSKLDHSMVCINELISLLKEQKKTVHDLSDIVVVNGPGSFTGVRLGVTIAKTLAYTLNIPIRTLTSLEILLPIEEKQGYLSIPEKNGFFIGKIEENKITEYNYLSKSEFSQLKAKNVVLDNMKVNYKTLIKEAHQKETISPHNVNPFYVKKIEVEK